MPPARISTARWTTPGPISAPAPKSLPEQGIPVQLASCHAVETAGKAVDLVHAAVGTTGIRNEHRFQQYFRDVHTVSQHAFGSPERFESVGKLLLGKKSDWAFFYL